MLAGEERQGPIGLAVSGGPDSLAVLLLAAVAYPGEIAVLSVDHGIRPEAAAEVGFVSEICAGLGVPFASTKVELEPGNLQAEARKARYKALSLWADEARLGAVVTAHHADDQAETLLMRLARGSGISGLAGVRDWSTLPGSKVPLLRPLLTFGKAELEAVCRAAGVNPVRDPSNEDTSFDRVRVRQHLEEHDWLDPKMLAASAAHLGEAAEVIAYYTQREWQEQVSRNAESFAYRRSAPVLVQIEIVRRVIAELGGGVSRAEAARAVERLHGGENASLGGVLGVPKRGCWHFSPEPPRS